MKKPAAIITGGSKGIGFATAQILLERGWRVSLIARQAALLDEARANLVAAGHASHDIELCALDLNHSEKIATTLPQLAFAREGLNGLINNAAVEILKPLAAFTSADFDSTWRVNMLAPVLAIQACLPLLKKSQGSVVNVSSISDRKHEKRYSLYGGSKAFLRQFSRHAAQELGIDGVRINVVSPGGVDTPLMQSMIDDGIFSAEAVRTAAESTPLEQRWATPREIAEAIFFALTGPRYLHGADLRIHGGQE